MLLLKLSDTQGRIFDESPEADMGLHFAQVEDELWLRARWSRSHASGDQTPEGARAIRTPERARAIRRVS
jgi:hypothetical protein